MTDRKPLPKKLRFEVFKRDKFTCQYCGATSPGVLLVVDHIKPVAGGGQDDLLNLATACQPCNAGKGARELGDESAVEKQRLQLEELQDRREQLDMMLDWRNGLLDLDVAAEDGVVDFWRKRTSTSIDKEVCRDVVRTLIRKHGVALVLEGIEDATRTYADATEAWRKLPAVVRGCDAEKKNPGARFLLRTRGYLRKIIFNADDHRYDQEIMDGLRHLLDGGWTEQEVFDAARGVRTITEFRQLAWGQS